MSSNPWIVDPIREDGKAATTTYQMGYVDAQGTARPIWVTVKDELSVGERRKMLKSISTVSQPMGRKDSGEETHPEAKWEWTDYSFARMVAFIVDWSLAHEADVKIRLAPNRKSYEMLREEVFTLIDETLDNHEKQAADAKKATAGKPRPAAISA